MHERIDRPPVNLRLDENDYCYGRGALTLRVDRIDRANPVRFDDDIWYRVEGVQIGWDGAEVGHRLVLVRVRRLPL